MRFNFSYIIIPIITVLVASLGGWVTSQGMSWYNSINLPVWTPSGGVIGAVWTIIFILSTTAALLIWNDKKLKQQDAPRWRKLMMIFALNAILNVTWSFVFFKWHLIDVAVKEAAILWLSVAKIMYLAWPVDKRVFYLMLPYALWVAFATYLTYSVWLLNI